MTDIIPALNVGTIPSLKSASYVSRALPFFVEEVKKAQIGGKHWHDYFQIWYTVSGSYTQEINGVKTYLPAGSVAIIFPFAIHSIDTSSFDSETTQIISVSLYDDLNSKNIMPLQSLSYDASAFDRFILSPVVHLSGKDKEVADILFASSLKSFSGISCALIDHKAIYNKLSGIFELLAKASQTVISPVKLRRAHEQLQAITAATTFISSHSLEDISLAEICTTACMSRSTFTHNFKIYTGQTFHEYFIATRMKTVIYLLRFTDMSIDDIAIRCGFHDGMHLSHTIKNMFGISPGVLRAQMRERSRRFGDYFMQKQFDSNAFLDVMTEAEIEAYHRNRHFIMSKFE